MANLQGYASGAIGHMLDHYTRHGGDPNQGRYTYRNQKIDITRTHLNYTIFERNDPKGFIKTKVAEADTKPTRSTNVLSDWIVTLPKDARLEGKEREFFETAFGFLCDKVGVENVVGGWVHLDETSPHLHFAFVPACTQAVTVNDKDQPLRWTASDEKRNPLHKAGEVKRDSKGTVRYKRVPAVDENGNPILKRTISQSKVFDRKAMRDFHPELSACMRERFGFDVGVELEDEGDKVLSRLEHGEYIAAKETLKKTKGEVKRLSDKREEIREQTDKEQARLEDLQQERSAAQKRVEIMDAVYSACSAADDAAISRKVSFFNQIVALCSRCVERLGVVVQVAKSAAETRLKIGVRYDTDPNAPIGARWPTAYNSTSPQQIEKELTM